MLAKLVFVAALLYAAAEASIIDQNDIVDYVMEDYNTILANASCTLCN